MLILPCNIIADDSASFSPQGPTYPPITSSDDAMQPVTDPEFSSDSLVAGSENNVADCHGPPPSRTRRSRFRKRQNDFCSWQEFKGGAPTTSPETKPPNAKIGPTGQDGVGATLIPTARIDPADVQKPDKEKISITNQFGRAGNLAICGTLTATIPVCHYSPERESSRWLSPIPALIPVRLCRFTFPQFSGAYYVYYWTDLWLGFAFL